MIAKIGAVLRSPALRAAFFLMAGGAGFAIANLLLARVLPAKEFGEISLLLALNQLGLSLGPLGLEVGINRRHLSASTALLALSSITSTTVGMALAATASVVYGLSIGLTVCLGIAAIASAVNRVACSFLQGQQRFGYSLFLGQIHNYVLLAAVPLIMLLGSNSAAPVALTIASGYVITSIAGWWTAWPRHAPPSDSPPLGPLVRDSLAGLGIILAVQMLWQLERLVIPRTLSMVDLGTFAVVAAIAGSPFRMMQIGIGHTLLPGLRACRSADEVRRLLFREGAVIGAAVVISVGVVFALTPLIEERFLMGRYEISMALLIAVVVTGLVKVWHGFASAIVQAFGSTATLFKLTVLSWIGVMAGVGSAIYGARFGLTGVVYGVGVAWLVTSAAATGFAIASSRKRSLLPATSATATPAPSPAK